MLDPKFIRENEKEVRENIKKRNYNPAILDKWLELDEEIRKLKQGLDDLRHDRNTISLEINELKKAGKEKEAQKAIKEVKELPGKIKEIEEGLEKVSLEANNLLLQIPNMLRKGVPSGKTAEDNKVIKKWGKIPKFNFPLKSHTELAESLGIADFEAGRNNAGQGFNYLIGELAILDLALQRYGIDCLIKNKFKVIMPPMMLNREALEGAVDLATFKEVIYKIENENFYMIGTAEHALVTLPRNTTLLEENLPLKIGAITPAFRKEIGGHGVDTKGIFRMHQFNKVEQVVFCKPENSDKMHEEMQKITEKFFQSLNIPYRVIELCAGDLGLKFAKQYDIEAWFPRQNEYKEVTSAGNCTDFQSRALNIKYKEKEGAVPKGFVYVLNNTMVATSRAMVAILENYQQKDGSIKIPKVLQKYTGFKEIKAKKK
jgi:seryl-tRNA synthetase